MKVGLRIDADTFRGTRHGVPNLIQTLAQHAISATFFFSVGPDNMGRHLRRLIHPSFLRKMLRSKAASLYGWDILLKGTLWPGPVIGEKLGGVMRSASEAGHEVGLHAWDHHAWQAHIDAMSPEDMNRSLERGFQMLARILGRAPACSGHRGGDAMISLCCKRAGSLSGITATAGVRAYSTPWLTEQLCLNPKSRLPCPRMMRRS